MNSDGRRDDTAGYACKNPGDADELDVMQISDSLFPTGMFASSNGLEYVFEQKMITDVHGLAILCQNMICGQIGTSDCTALAVAYDAITYSDTVMIEYADAACSCMKTVPEARDAAVRSGVQLCRCVSEFCDNAYLHKYLDCIKAGTVSGVYPVALGVCCCALGIPKEKAILMLLYGFAASMASAALRLGMIQHIEAQKMIHKLKPAIRRVAAACTGQKNPNDMWQFCPHAEILQMSHARMDAKMFIT